MAEQKKKTIEILHPIEHDQVHYGRGVIDLDESLADKFLALRDTVSGAPIARLPEPKAATSSEGTRAGAPGGGDAKT